MPSGVYVRTKPVWNKGLTKDDPRVAKNTEHKNETCLKKYGTKNVMRTKEVLDKISEARHSGELAKKL